MKRSKQSYFTKYFKRNLKNIKNTWKEIKIITSMRNSSSITPTLVPFQNITIGYPGKIAIIFNNFFSTIGEKTLAKIKYLYKVTLFTSQIKTLSSFPFYQQAKKKLI